MSGKYFDSKLGHIVDPDDHAANPPVSESVIVPFEANGFTPTDQPEAVADPILDAPLADGGNMAASADGKPGKPIAGSAKRKKKSAKQS